MFHLDSQSAFLPQTSCQISFQEYFPLSDPSVFPPQFVKGDIQSMDLLSFVLKTEEIDTVMHFAAQVSEPE